MWVWGGRWVPGGGSLGSRGAGGAPGLPLGLAPQGATPTACVFYFFKSLVLFPVATRGLKRGNKPNFKEVSWPCPDKYCMGCVGSPAPGGYQAIASLLPPSTAFSQFLMFGVFTKFSLVHISQM